jgi:hypothetical protein
MMTPELAERKVGMARKPATGPGNWVLLSYRMPREPSTPRITIWRKLKRLGVAQIGDGLIALPADARTREQLDWIAEEIVESGGSANVWLAQPATRAQERGLAADMAAARSEEYRIVIDQAAAASRVPETERIRTVRRLRDELRRIHRRDYFPPAERDTARQAVESLAEPRTAADSPEIQP